MDNLTHSLIGVALSRSGLNRVVPHATTLMLLAANAPDFDIVSLAGGRLAYLEAHRGYSHSLIVAPLLACLPVLLTAIIFRVRLPWKAAWLISMVGVLSHLLIDLTTSYGIRLFLPFSSGWEHLDLVSLGDGVLWAVLLFATAWPFLGSLVNQEIGARRSHGSAMAIFALTFFCLYDASRAVIHQHVVGQLEARIYEGRNPIRVAAMPDWLNPFQWRAIVELSADYRTYPLEAYGDFDPERSSTYYKHPLRAASLSARKTEIFRFFQYFTRFPLWAEQATVDEGQAVTRVQLSDLQFGPPGATPFTVTAIVDSHNEVKRASFGRDARAGR